MPSSPPPSSRPPPSSLIPGRQASSAPYIVGIVLLAVLMAALLIRANKEPSPTAPSATVPPPPPHPPDFGPPPPPMAEDAGVDADASTDAGEEKEKKVSSSGKRVGGRSPCDACGQGVGTDALTSAVRARAGMARGCYNQALKHGEAEGRLMVSVSIGHNGSVCGASIVSDSVGHAGISSCVVAKFRAASYPKPKSGCVVVNVPISFKMK